MKNLKETMSAVQLREAGSLYTPDRVRERYEMENGDEFTLVDLGTGDFIYLKSKPISHR